MKPNKDVICSDSSSTLTSIHNMLSNTRQDVVLGITQTMHRARRAGVEVNKVDDKYAQGITMKGLYLYSKS